MSKKRALPYTGRNWVKFYTRLEALAAERAAQSKIKRKSMSPKAVARRQRATEREEYRQQLPRLLEHWEARSDPAFVEFEAEARKAGLQDWTVETPAPRAVKFHRWAVIQDAKRLEELFDRLVCVDERKFSVGRDAEPLRIGGAR